MKKSLLAITGLCIILAAGIFSFFTVTRLKSEIQGRFEGKRWDLPAVIYARPLEMYPGQNMTAQMLENELLLSGYRQEENPQSEGSYERKGNVLQLVSRGFYFPTGFEPAQRVRITFNATSISSIVSSDKPETLSNVRLDPATIGSFQPLAHEDRIVLQYEEIPKQLIDTLLAIEDQHFFRHSGVAPLAILRALIVNIKAGETVQGGSTITQQLVKNLFLNHERTASRKIKEAIMALLLDWRYSKQEILTAYINEVFLGQDGNRAIHGFALASQYYFHRAVQDLNPGQIAMLVGMVKGPSYYDPQRNPENCKERRRVILKKMADLQMINHQQHEEAVNQPLLDVKIQKGGFNRFPAFLDLVREQLAREYKGEDLKSNGLQILTTLDPRVQFQIENSLKDSIVKLEQQLKKEGIEGAMVVTNRDNGDILGITGGKNPAQKSFNRAMLAKRPIGSLVKPAIYLTALENGYSLASPLDDSYYSFTGADGKEWIPQNYDKDEHGRVALYYALAHSYNLATVRLGMEMGLPKVMETLKKLGYSTSAEPLPSMLLGAIEMTPFDVAQMYQTYAADGFFTPLKAITAVMAADHSVLNRYGISVEQRFQPQTVFLLNHALQRVCSEGTAHSIKKSSLRNHTPAGKTGTTNDLRDSWFAGFTGDHLAVVWLGRDDNSPLSLTGASGALSVWTRVLSEIQTEPLTLTEPEDIIWKNVDQTTLQTTEDDGFDVTRLPFISGQHKQTNQDATKEGEAKNPQDKEGLLETIKGWLN